MDKRTPQRTFDTGSPTSRARDDLRTASKRSKPMEKRDESRDKNDRERAERSKTTPKRSSS